MAGQRHKEVKGAKHITVIIYRKLSAIFTGYRNSHWPAFLMVIDSFCENKSTTAVSTMNEREVKSSDPASILLQPTMEVD